jgi:hypothetical protein
VGLRQWLSPLLKHPVELESPLPPAEVAQALSDNLARGVGSFVMGSTSPRGRVDGDRFMIRANNPYLSHNTASYEYSGQIVPDGNGSRLVGQAGPNGSQPAIVVSWFGLLVLFEFFFILFAIDPNSTSPPFPRFMVLVPLGFAVFGIALVAGITAHAKAGWRATEEWLVQLLSARRPDSPH